MSSQRGQYEHISNVLHGPDAPRWWSVPGLVRLNFFVRSLLSCSPSLAPMHLLILLLTLLAGLGRLRGPRYVQIRLDER